MSEPTIREPEEIRRDCARKLRAVQVSNHFQAILGCLLSEDWTTPHLVEMVITPDGHMLGRCDGQASFAAFLGASEDLVRNIHGSPRSQNSTATSWATCWARWRKSSGERSG